MIIHADLCCPVFHAAVIPDLPEEWDGYVLKILDFIQCSSTSTSAATYGLVMSTFATFVASDVFRRTDIAIVTLMTTPLTTGLRM
jgi:hypothetical protein